MLTSVIFTSFTFIFFALEGSIMAQGLRHGLGLPLWLGYLVSTVVIIPLVVYGMKALAKLQTWTNPLWLVLIVAPIGYLVVADPGSVQRFLDHKPGVDAAAVMLGAGVCLSLMAQIGEQIDYLRFMPPKTAANRRSWWISMIAAGPGWVFSGAAKQIIGGYLAVYIVDAVGAAAAVEPIEQFTGALKRMLPVWLVVPLALLLVVLSQVKINVTNAYSGSLAWTNSVTRVRRRYPGRLVFVVVNLAFALILMEADMFSFLNSLLSFYSTCAIAWVVTVATDIMVNKFLLGLSPKQPEFRRGMLYAVNPVGVTTFVASSSISIAIHFGAFGSGLQPFAPVAAMVIALVLTPAMAIATRGGYYLRRTDDGIDEPMLDADGNPSGARFTCQVCEQGYERAGRAGERARWRDLLALPEHRSDRAARVACASTMMDALTGHDLRPRVPCRHLYGGGDRWGFACPR
ncbi:purine-cytosine permease-like protein [Kibdelosporangium phytohabitans]|nr:purine-cytosine permease-like protein [Kibdelosporangium phytohabitans]